MCQDNLFVSKVEKGWRDLHRTIFIDQSDWRTNLQEVFPEYKHPDTRIDLIVTEKMYAFSLGFFFGGHSFNTFKQNERGWLGKKKTENLWTYKINNVNWERIKKVQAEINLT